MEMTLGLVGEANAEARARTRTATLVKKSVRDPDPCLALVTLAKTSMAIMREVDLWESSMAWRSSTKSWCSEAWAKWSLSLSASMDDWDMLERTNVKHAARRLFRLRRLDS